MKLLLLNILFCFCISAHAQMSAVAKGTPRTVTAPTLSRRVATASATPRVYNRGVAESIAAQIYHQALKTSAPTVSVLISPAPRRSWLQQQTRNLKAWKLKREHAAYLQDLHAQQLFEQALASLPQPQPQRSFAVPTLDGLTQVQTSIPPFPGLARQGYLYRGLGLSADAAALRNILKNGLRLQDVGPDANNLITSWGVERASLAEYKTLSSTQVINLTSSPNHAVSFALKNAQLDSQVPVVVVTQGIEETGNVVRIYTDIPPTQIREVFALLMFDVPTWCRIELEEGQLKVTPYDALL